MKADVLLPLLNEHKEVCVTPIMFDELFNAPSHVDPIKQLALTMYGHRAEMEQREQVELWLNTRGVEYRYSPIDGNHYFKFKNSISR